MNFSNTLTILSLLNHSGRVVTGSFAVKTWVEYCISALSKSLEKLESADKCRNRDHDLDRTRSRSRSPKRDNGRHGRKTILRRLRRLVGQIETNDLDIVVTSTAKYFCAVEHEYMPESIGNYMRKQSRPCKSCTYTDGDVSFDLIYDDSVEYYTIKGVDFIHPETLFSKYEEVVEDCDGVKYDQVLIKLDALELICEILPEILGRFDFKTSPPEVDEPYSTGFSGTSFGYSSFLGGGGSLGQLCADFSV